MKTHTLSKLFFFSALAILLVLAIGRTGQSMEKQQDTKMEMKGGTTATAVFAGGCFWCTESDFEKLPGVTDAISGYTGGKVADPSYEQVSAGGTGHIEAVEVRYRPDQVSYQQLLDWFWRHVDPTDPGGQFVDRGSQYLSAIFYADEEQRRLAEASKAKLAASGRFDKPIVTEILPLGAFYQAEEYHQDYYAENPIRYHFYRYNSGRDQFLEKVWGKEQDKLPGSDLPTEQGMQDGIKQSMRNETGTGTMEAAGSGTAMAGTAAGGAMNQERKYTIPDNEELKRILTPTQYHVTRENGTEAPFENVYYNNHEEGIYVDVISGEPLFSSTDKFESGTGWPSFTRPLEKENVVEHQDRSWFMVRTEVRSRHADSHLGHVFNDGPPPTGLRYCINSAALRFIPKAELEKEGYGDYLSLFK